jgi:hypothetical protein
MQAAEVPHTCSASSSAAQTSLGGERGLAWTATCIDGCDLNKLGALHGTHGYIILLCNWRPENAAKRRRLFESVRPSFHFTR